MVSASAPDVESIRAPATISAPMPRFFKMLYYPVLRSRPNFSDSDSDSCQRNLTSEQQTTPSIGELIQHCDLCILHIF